jgi:hypothetical protein
MLLRLDHLVIAVPDPEAAAVELERTVGLTCTGGGRHPLWGTHNRLAWLGDTYVELIGVFDPTLATLGPVSRPVLAALMAGQSGLVSFALATDDAAADAARLRASGSPIGEPETRSRTRPDGEVVTWHAAYGELGPALPPFIVEHEPTGAEWSDDAIAARAAFEHPLGGRVRVVGLEIPVPDVTAAAAAYAQTVGLEVDASSSTAHVGDQSIRLVPGRPLTDPAVVELALEGAPTVVRRDVDACGVRWRIRS